MEADITTQVVGLTSNTDFSIVNLFIQIQKIVILFHYRKAVFERNPILQYHPISANKM